MTICIHGHNAGRDASGHCIVCRNEYKKAYYKAHPKKRNRQRRKARANAKRRAEIIAAKAVLMSAHRLRIIGVRSPPPPALARSPAERRMTLRRDDVVSYSERLT